MLQVREDRYDDGQLGATHNACATLLTWPRRSHLLVAAAKHSTTRWMS